jgi:addiction module RelE/StbE family toxin
MVQIKWLNDAKTDLREIYEYISADSKLYARQQIVKIKHATEIIKTHPNIGKPVEEIDDPSIRELVEGNYRIIYRIVNSKNFHILMVHHGARNLFRRIKS